MILSTFATLSLTLSAPAAPDVPAPGFSGTEHNGFSTGFLTSFWTLSDGSFVVYEPDGLFYYQPDGTLIRELLPRGGAAESWGVAVDPTETFVIACDTDFAGGGIFRAELAGGPVFRISNLLSSDVCFDGPDHVLIAYGDIFGTNSILWRVDVQTGDRELLVTGATFFSPVATDADRNVYIAHASGADWRITRFDAAQVQGGTTLNLTDGTLLPGIFGWIDGMTVDPEDGGIYVSERVGSESRIVTAGGNALAPRVLVNVSAPERALRQIQFYRSEPRAVFAGFQPAGGGRLEYSTWDGMTWRRKNIEPERPMMDVSGPGTMGPGTLNVSIAEGPPNGTAFLFYGPSAGFNPTEIVLNLRLPVFLGLDPATMRRAPGTIALDGGGNAARSYPNSMGLTGFALQSFLLDELGRVAGSSDAVLF